MQQLDKIQNLLLEEKTQLSKKEEENIKEEQQEDEEDIATIDLKKIQLENMGKLCKVIREHYITIVIYNF